MIRFIKACVCKYIFLFLSKTRSHLKNLHERLNKLCEQNRPQYKQMLLQ